ncbi:hypothetical protein FAM09_28020 [Niastella caeni]|uniref:Uncharacterized protein n=1 Tax=Niastella caeni TaxID=2569763 RepID=A0A4S8HEY8_9BACT|nr:hypothetical protein [Niastella caeni]THU32034.1 hypothetical protein FAM09_28020 [Niastella caeni]
MKKFFTSVIIVGVLFACMQLAGCDKKNDGFTSDAVTDYVNLQTGKYVLYRLDSTRFVSFGQKDTVISYHAKDVVEGQVTDNLGRAGWRIVRYLRDTGSTSESDWWPVLTYQVIPTRENIEVNEANFRYLKLVLPVKEGYSWRGNGYLPDNPYVDLYEFSNDEDIQDWDYTYHDIGMSASFNNKTYDSTITVVQIADSTNLPITAGIPASKTFWVEKYAKNIGLVYKEVEMWEYQPPTGSSSGYRHGFGIKMTIIGHN